MSGLVSRRRSCLPLNINYNCFVLVVILPFEGFWSISISFYSIFCAFDNATKLLGLPIYEGIVHVAFIKSIFSEEKNIRFGALPQLCAVLQIICNFQ